MIVPLLERQLQPPDNELTKRAFQQQQHVGLWQVSHGSSCTASYAAALCQMETMLEAVLWVARFFCTNRSI